MNFLLDSNALILSKGRISVTASVGYAEDSDRHNSICPIKLIWSRYYIDASTSFLSGHISRAFLAPKMTHVVCNEGTHTKIS
jgi:hypothetical protein